MAYTLGQLAREVNAEVIGDPEVSIESIGSLLKAGPGQITFLSQPAYRKQLKQTRASAVVLSHKDKDLSALPRLVCDNPYAAFAVLSRIFHTPPMPQAGVHALAAVADDCRIGAQVSIAAGAVIAAGVTLGDECVIGPNCFVGEGSTAGARCRLAPGVALMHDVHLGDDVLIHANAVVGSDGFGYANDQGDWLKIMHSGRVVIGNAVEIGANTTIDRGTLEDTVIEDGVKIDNLVQIGHNVRIGAHTVVCGCVGISGSTKIGRHCLIGGAAGIHNNLTICDHTTVFPMASVARSIDQPGEYSSLVSLGPRIEMYKNSLRVNSLGKIKQRLDRLEKIVTEEKKDE